MQELVTTNEMFSVRTSKIGDEDVQTISARTLHERLGSSTRFNDWITRRIETYGFVEGQDFTVLKNEYGENTGFAPIEYAITLDMAKELAMVENNSAGREIRQYFIAAEKEMRHLQLEKTKLLESKTKRLESRNAHLRDENGYLSNKASMWKNQRIEQILREEIMAQVKTVHLLENEIYSDTWDCESKMEVRSRIKFVKSRFRRVKKALEGLEKVFAGTDQATNIGVLTYIDVIRAEIAFASEW